MSPTQQVRLRTPQWLVRRVWVGMRRQLLRRVWPGSWRHRQCRQSRWQAARQGARGAHAVGGRRRNRRASHSEHTGVPRGAGRTSPSLNGTGTPPHQRAPPQRPAAAASAAGSVAATGVPRAVVAVAGGVAEAAAPAAAVASEHRRAHSALVPGPPRRVHSSELSPPSQRGRRPTPMARPPLGLPPGLSAAASADVWATSVSPSDSNRETRCAGRERAPAPHCARSHTSWTHGPPTAPTTQLLHRRSWHRRGSDRRACAPRPPPPQRWRG